jgi:hypothetical protein
MVQFQFKKVQGTRDHPVFAQILDAAMRHDGMIAEMGAAPWTCRQRRQNRFSPRRAICACRDAHDCLSCSY